MTRESFGVLLGWAMITITAWFMALALIGYIGGSIYPWEWSPEKRSLHLAIQFSLIIAYIWWMRRVRR